MGPTSKADRRAHVAWLKSITASPELPEADRRETRTRARVLEHFFKLKHTRRRK